MQLSRRSFFTYSAGGALALVVVDPLTGAHVALADALASGHASLLVGGHGLPC